MDYINLIKEKAKNNVKKIVLPESMDERVIEAASICSNEGIAEIILIGNPCTDKFDLSKVTIIVPEKSNLTEELINNFYQLRKDKGVTIESSKEILLSDYMYYACMLVKNGYADGVVSGACHSTSNTLRPALQIIKTKESSDLVSAFFLMIVPEKKYGETFIFADSGLVQNPSASDLASIAKDSSDSYKLLTGNDPVCAFLSHSTFGSAVDTDEILKVREGVKIAKEKFPNYLMDGEMQLDAAIVPDVAKSKAPESNVAGHANVLVFPDLDAGNIGYKLVQRLANAEAYGPITQGIRKPINDLSRGCNVNDIVGVVAITSIQVED